MIAWVEAVALHVLRPRSRLLLIGHERISFPRRLRRRAPHECTNEESDGGPTHTSFDGCRGAVVGVESLARLMAGVGAHSAKHQTECDPSFEPVRPPGRDLWHRNGAPCQGGNC